MNVTIIRDLHQARPFVPFTFGLADGRKLRVKQMDHLAIASSGRFAVLTHDDDTLTIIDLNLVVTADTGEILAAPGSP